ncbi:hypothetical protein L2E82_25754 [Cichorium intybus]|uniref:Uncharacterized protein n=1 Tax=Cichorium intybus TaxID=13427 RepID=A0ACB9E537_CICIN|nr:hypothetical protein L2E82_25754 [Cichorium intybus]
MEVKRMINRDRATDGFSESNLLGLETYGAVYYGPLRDQTTGYSHMKVSLLQDSFVRQLWSKIGKKTYIHLIGSSEELLGVPVTVHQTLNLAIGACRIQEVGSQGAQ